MTDRKKQGQVLLRGAAILAALILLGVGLWLTFGSPSCPVPV